MHPGLYGSMQRCLAAVSSSPACSACLCALSPLACLQLRCYRLFWFFSFLTYSLATPLLLVTILRNVLVRSASRYRSSRQQLSSCRLGICSAICFVSQAGSCRQNHLTPNPNRLQTCQPSSHLSSGLVLASCTADDVLYCKFRGLFALLYCSSGWLWGDHLGAGAGCRLVCREAHRHAVRLVSGGSTNGTTQDWDCSACNALTVAKAVILSHQQLGSALARRQGPNQHGVLN